MEPVVNSKSESSEPIAIIGMACVFPEAPNLKAFWQNIVQCVDAVGEPQAAWEAERYLESGRINTPYGGYLKDLFRFDPREFGIMPNSVDGGEPDQFLALKVARDALLDAGYLDDDYDHTDTGIILGHSTYLHRGQGNHVQHHIVLDQTMEILAAAAPSLSEDKLAEVRQLLTDKLPQSNADIAPGLVPNVMTGRIANRLNLNGPNYILDAACSSSLLAVGAAMDELRNHRSNLMLAGGVNASLPAEVSVIFTQLGALSERGKVRPFSKGSDGTLLGEGLGTVVLKRLSDAEADGDKIYAVIRGIGQASDGRGHGLLAPSVEGEALAIKRAYRDSGVDPSTIGLVEAHGTGIPLGDQTEVSALGSVLGERQGSMGSVALGSVKSMISHCIPAAGIAGLIKTSLALHHKVLPPTLCEEVNPDLEIEKTPLYVNTALRPWFTSNGIPRRAGVNSFGFGGINTHAILEEAPAQVEQPLNYSNRPAELFALSASSHKVLADKIRQLQPLAEAENYTISELAAEVCHQDQSDSLRVAFVVKDHKDLAKKLKQTLKKLDAETSGRWSTRNGVMYSDSPLPGKLAFIFPGEGSQYLSMLEELSLHFPEVRDWFDFWRGLYGNDEPGSSRTDLVFPPEIELTPEVRASLEQRLHDMDVGSEAVFVGSQAMNGLLKAFSVEPDAMLGHSTGESSALVASGAIDNTDLDQLASFIRELNSVYLQVLESGGIHTGALLTVGALDPAVIDEHIAELSSTVYVAMDNCANQKVLFGDVEAIASLQKTLSSAGGICVPLPFDRGYHTPLFSAVTDAFQKYYADVGVKKPELPLYSCASAGVFPDKQSDVVGLAASQWSETVRFADTITAMHDDGIQYFVEVGPSGNLTAFVNEILSGKEYVSVASNIRKKSSVEQFLLLLGQLYVNQKSVDIDRLFKGRAIERVDLANSAPRKLGGMVLDNTMPVLHLTDEDRTQLHSMFGTAETVNLGSSKPVSANIASITELESHPEMAVISEVNGTEVVTDEVAASNDGVMADYFDLMRGFLSQQETLFTSSAVESVELSASDNTVYETAPFPFISEIIEQSAEKLNARCDLNVYEDKFLQDHILSGMVSETDRERLGLSCVPMMVSLEIMAEAVAVLANNVAIRTIENVKAYDWIALDDMSIELDVSAEVVSSENQRFSAAIRNRGALVVEAEFTYAPELVEPRLADLGTANAYRWSDDELYSTGMFHGPIFQSIRGIEGWNDQGIDAALSEVSLSGFFTENASANLVLNPVLLDALGQLAAYWIAQQVGTDFNSFPSSIEKIELPVACPKDLEGLRLLGRQHPVDPKATDVESPRAWQFECVDADGNVLLSAKNLVNIFFPVPNRFYHVRRDPLNGWLGAGSSLPDTDILLWTIPHLDEAFCAQSGGVFMRILAHLLLSYDELNEWRALTGNVRHKREWLLGRATLKESVRYWVYQQTSTLLYPSDVEVVHDELGAPYVTGLWTETLIPAPAVSLSHNGNQCRAAVTANQESIGIDIEQVAPNKSYDFLTGTLSPNELNNFQSVAEQSRNDYLVRSWCVKEAAAKLLRVGLQGQPEKFEVIFFDELYSQAQVSYQGYTVMVSVSESSGLVTALAV
jgi:acyl transferase domain-containing protein/phosphopantetheinyl transferase